MAITKEIKPLSDIDIGTLANKGGEAATNTFNSCKGVNNVDGATNVGVQDTKNVLEVLGFNKALRV